ncbi:ATP synthase subunit epsilon [Striga asiatica]|uniref:ATP synthase subunit epsilon n=1 Tax=Striga asiatica TaxID=4170 RepID=A0A5A7PWT1_STRAF|nr:ATP synthase subunit epsilon [Striga asiatica]
MSGRNRCLKEPYKSEALTLEKLHFAISDWADGRLEKPIRDLEGSGLDLGISGFMPWSCRCRQPQKPNLEDEREAVQPCLVILTEEDHQQFFELEASSNRRGESVVVHNGVAVVIDIPNKMKRTARLGMPVQMTEEEKRRVL